MLTRFNVGNFLSFKEVTEFSMLKGKPKNKGERIYSSDSLKILKFSALFGANASGKSNFVKSLAFARNLIVSSLLKKRSLKDYVFKLDDGYRDKPSYFEFEILQGEHLYSYGFEVLLNENRFISEWLVKLSPHGSDVNLFTRDLERGEITTELKIGDKSLNNKFNVYLDDIKENNEVLFLSEMNRNKGSLYREKSALSIFRDLFHWFDRRLEIIYPNKPISPLTNFWEGKEKETICRIIKDFSTGIINYEEVEVDLEQAQNITTTSLKFSHGEGTPLFDFSEESDGTKRILDLLEILLTKQNKVFVIDEIDRSLHPQLTYRFIKHFLTLAEKRDMQLIVTTHESRLLDFDLLRQDEIWLSEKNKEGSTNLYSLDEYNVRFDRKVDKAYLEGRYGGVPIFTTLFANE